MCCPKQTRECFSLVAIVLCGVINSTESLRKNGLFVKAGEYHCAFPRDEVFRAVRSGVCANSTTKTARKIPMAFADAMVVGYT